MSSDNSTNERRYFRVSTRLALEYEIMDEDQFSHRRSKFGSNENDNLLKQLQEATAQTQQSLMSIMEKDRELATFLSSLNHRMELIAQLFGLQDSNAQISRTFYTSEISEGGLTFGAPESIPVGTCVAVNLILKGYPAGLVLFAHVRANKARERKSKLHPVSIEFSKLEDSTAAKLSRELMLEQST